jgi:hypothetical protein
MEETPKSYTYESLLEMLGGYEYYSENQIQYVYHTLNGNLEIAEDYLQQCLEDNRKVQYALEKIDKNELLLKDILLEEGDDNKISK